MRDVLRASTLQYWTHQRTNNSTLTSCPSRPSNWGAEIAVGWTAYAANPTLHKSPTQQPTSNTCCLHHVEVTESPKRSLSSSCRADDARPSHHLNDSKTLFGNP